MKEMHLFDSSIIVSERSALNKSETELKMGTKYTFKRDVYFKLESTLQESHIVFLIGPRKSGKTVCLKQLDNAVDDSVYYDFKRHTDEDNYKFVQSVIDSIKKCDNKLFLLDEITYLQYYDLELEGIAEAFAEFNSSVRIVFTGSQSVALKYFGMKSFSASAAYVTCDFINYSEWLRFKSLEASDDSFVKFVTEVDQFYEFTSMREYLQSCIDETINSNKKSYALALDKDPCDLEVGDLVTVMYSVLLSLHNRVNFGKTINPIDYAGSIKFYYRNQLGHNPEGLVDLIDKSILAELVSVKKLSIAQIREALLFLYRCGLITLVYVTNDFDDGFMIYKWLKGSNDYFNGVNDLLSRVNVCVKYPMFYVAIMKDVFGLNYFKLGISRVLLGSIVECYVRGLLDSANPMNCYSADDGEIDCFDSGSRFALEITISDKRSGEYNFNLLPSDWECIALTKSIKYDGRIQKIPYYEFVLDLCTR